MSKKATDFDSVLSTCQNQHRRIVLRALAGKKRPLTLDEVIEAILKHDHQTTPTEASEEVRTEIRLSLNHVHLPKLASEGFVQYDRAHELLEPTEKLGQLQPTLSTIFDADPSLDAPMAL